MTRLSAHCLRCLPILLLATVLAGPWSGAVALATDGGTTLAQAASAPTDASPAAPTPVSDPASALATPPADAAAVAAPPPPAPPKPLPTDPLAPPLYTTLPNGLSLVIKEVRAAPVVAVNVWIHAGARNETPGEEGYAHLIEHMLFKGTPRFKTGELDRAIKKLGATNNAFTAADYTCYHVFGAREHFGRLLELVSDAVLHSSFDPVEFEKEKQVVIEELRMDLDDPTSANYNAMKAAAYTTHPYRHPIVGFKSGLDNCTRDKLFAFYRRHYLPAKMVVVVVGDVDSTTAVAEIKKIYGDLPREAPPTEAIPAEPRQEQRREVVQQGEVQQAYLNLAWHVPGIASPDNITLDVMSTLLGGGRSSRLHQKLVEELRLVTQIEASYYTGQDPSLFTLFTELPQGKVREAIEQAAAVVYKLRDEPVPATELAKAKQQIVSTALFSRESPDHLAETYGHYATLGVLEEADRYLDRIKAVTPADIQRVANEYFRDGNLTIARYEPRLATAAMLPEMITLDNGLRLILKENHASPLVAMAVLADAGGLREDKRQAGLANLMAQTLLKGVQRGSRSNAEREGKRDGGDDERDAPLNARAVAEAFEQLGANIDVKAYKSYSLLSLETLTEKFLPALELTVDCLTRPTFPTEEVEKETARAIEVLRAQDDDLFPYTFYRSLAALYPDTPLAYPPQGIEKDLRGLKRSEVVDFHHRYIVADGMVVALVGDFYLADVKPRLVELLSRLPKGGREREALKAFKVAALGAPVTVENRKDKEQAQIVVATRSFPRSDPRTPALDVLQSLLSGSMCSRLFTNLRDKDSLAYSVWASASTLPIPGFFYATLSTAASKTDTAVKRLLEELDSVRNDGCSPEELEDARQFLIGQHALSLVTNRQQAEKYSGDEFFGLGFDYHRRYPELIKAVDASALKHVAEAVLPSTAPEAGATVASGGYVLGITPSLISA